MLPHDLIAAAASSMVKAARGWTPTHTKAHIQRRWNAVSPLVEGRGVMVGGNRRLLIPKSKLTAHDLHHLGFVPVKIAVPEAGQTALRSFRHPDHNFHIHEHGDQWSVHYDKHPSTSMLLHKVRTQAQAGSLTARNALRGLGGASIAAVAGMPHLIGEGVPGMGHYLAGRLTGAPGLAQRVQAQLPQDVTRKLMRLRDSPTAKMGAAPDEQRERHNYYVGHRAAASTYARRYRALNEMRLQRKAQRYRKMVASGMRRQKVRLHQGNAYAYSGVR